jgi:predicted dehydrogenase
MIKFGIVGMGIRGTLFADTIRQNPYAELIAVTDVSETNLQKAVNDYGVHGYADAADMIRREPLDAIVIATPDFLHKQPVLLAAERGIHMMVEKPFTTSVEEAEAMRDAVAKAGVKCMVALENRWNSPFVAVKQSVDSGEIGNIVTLNSRLNDTIYVPTRMLKWASRSSPGWFLLPHVADIACWLKGVRPTVAYAVGTKKKLAAIGLDTYDSIQAIVSFEDGTHAAFTTSWILPESMPLIYDFKYEIIGERGALYVDLADQMVRRAADDYRHLHTLGMPIDGRLTSAPSHMLNSFIDNIRLDTKPAATEEDGLLNTRVVDAIHRSIISGRPEPV